ncbi:MAG TPA: AAA family ATPase [Patescibacteria group bacterium]
MDFIGNKKAIDFLKKAVDGGHVNHAYLFSGPESVGKSTLAKMFAQHVILGKSFDEVDAAFESKDAILDLAIIAPEITEKNGISKQRDISIETIRDAMQDLSLYPYRGKRKVLIIEDAHKLNVSAQNALLKTLEEPNETTMIILVTHEVDRILPTILSRCQMLNFSLAKNAEISQEFTLEIAALSMGRPGLAKILSDNSGEREMHQEALGQLHKILSGSLNEKIKLAEELSKNLPDAINKIKIWIWMLRVKALEAQEAQRNSIYATIERIQKSEEVLKKTNANGRLVLEALFVEI